MRFGAATKRRGLAWPRTRGPPSRLHEIVHIVHGMNDLDVHNMNAYFCRSFRNLQDCQQGAGKLEKRIGRSGFQARKGFATPDRCAFRHRARLCEFEYAQKGQNKITTYPREVICIIELPILFVMSPPCQAICRDDSFRWFTS
jgi:hypothetical protein